MKSKYLSLILILTISILCSTTAIGYPVGDLDQNWKVDIEDLKLFAQPWLSLPDCFGAPGCADLIGNDRVDLVDFALLFANWQLEQTPTLVINEFQASNDTTIQDPDDPGEYPDWIEIYNYGSSQVDMGGMLLADDNNTFTIPSGVSINAGQYLLFWADNETGQGPRHTNFKLNADGDQVHLYTIDSDLIDTKTYSQVQLADESLGRYPDNDPAWYSMRQPSPGLPNTAGLASDVYFSRLSGVFTSNFSLELSTESPTATIRYTTDGSIPTAASTLYTGPITINNSQARRIRALTFDPPLVKGHVISHYYIPIASDIQSFSSNLPIVIIDSFGTDIDNNGGAGCWDFTYSYQPVASVFIDIDKDTLLASTTDVPDFAGRAGTRIRGESSRCWPKRQYAFEIWDDNNEDLNASLLGFAPESDWVLNAPYGDKTLLRNILAYKWANDIEKGFAAPGTRLVEVFFNQTTSNTSYADYRGVYVLTEKIKVSDNRVDIAQLDPTDTTEPDISGGYLLRVDKDNGQEYFNTAANMVTNIVGQGIQYYDPDEFELIEIQKTWIQNWFDQFETDLNASDFHDPSAGYAQHINKENFMEFDVLLELFKNIDGFKLSTYFHKERNGKLTFGPHWDYNFSSGNNWIPDWGFLPRYSMTTNYTDGEGWWNDGFAVYAWHNRLMQDDDYKLGTADKWFEHRQDKLSDAQINADIDYYYSLLTTNVAFAGGADNAADRNFARWPILDQYEWGNYYYGNNSSEPEQGDLPHTYHMETEWLKNWFTGLGSPAPGESYIADYTDRADIIDDFWDSDRNIAAPPALLIGGSPTNTGGNIAVGSSLTMSAATPGTIYYTDDGTDPRTWTQPPAGGGASPFTRMLVTENAAKAVLVPGAPVNNNWKGGGSFIDSGWNDYTYVSDKPGGVGYEADINGTYDDYISYDTISTMHNIHPTCYIRTSFSVDAADLPDMDYMTLRVRFDDAFIAYINGTEVARSSLAPASPAWDSATTDNVWLPSDSIAFTDYNITADLGLLNPGGSNILAIHGLNSGDGSSDMLISYELEAGAGGGPGGSPIPGGAVSATAVAYSGPVTLNATKQIKARIKNGSNWSALNEAIFSMNNVAPSLRITELMYHPADPNDEYIELKNIGGSSIDVALCQFTKGVNFTFPSIVLAPNEYVVVARNVDEFNSKYPSFSGNLAGAYTGNKLDNGGENIRLKDAAGVIIQEFDYEDGWFPITDGKGFSLNIIDPTDAVLDNWNKRLSWQASNVLDGTPGQDHTANTVSNDTVVINEVLTHTDDLVYGDWIELKNTTGASVNIGNWFLSDDKDNLKKYKIASDTTIPANGYLVFTSVANFRNALDPGSNVQFGLSEHGEDVFLSSGNGTVLTGGYSVGENFGSAKNNVTFGRYTKGAPTFNTDFVQMTSQTRGTANPATPYVPDVVITEIMYNAQSIQDLLGEYIELYNRSGSTVNLYDTANPSNTWKFTKGIDYTFPTGVSLTAGQRILISRANPAAFKTANSVSGVTVYGPYENDTELANDGEKLELSMPTDPDPGTGFISYIRVEQVNYSDGIHPLGNDPWPTSPDARGDSLHRTSVSSYSNDVSNWNAASPTPGS